ncbi:MAG: hypothetical protein COX19_07120, partial [Desulfobacterales bacterium CG23_combo_of_CG06-09_8_20_14_all_51_8]
MKMLKKSLVIHILFFLLFFPHDCRCLELFSENRYYYPEIDAFVYEKSKINSGNYSELYVRFQKEDNFGGVRSVIKFDVSEIPKNAEVIEASLYVYALDENTSLNHPSIEAYSAPSHWDESSLNWSQVDDKDAQIHTSSFTAGIPDSSPDSYYWNITDMVQSWVNGSPNYGVVLKTDSKEFDDYIRFYSRENLTFKPYLNVIYAPPALSLLDPEFSENMPAEAFEIKIDDQIQSNDLPPDQIQTPARPNPPVITQHPVSQKKNPGDSVTFSVSASGTPPLSFQWLKDGKKMDGQTAETLTIDSVSKTDEGVFTCRVTDDNGSVEAVAAILSVSEPAVITTQPESMSKTQGESVTFSVTAAGTPPISFQWKKNHMDIQGATSNRFTIKSVQEKDAGVYVCEVKNDFSNDMSAEAMLVVLFPPQITCQPKPQKIDVGMPAAFSVSASGTPPLSFQWLKDGNHIDGQTAETLTIDSVSEKNKGVFTCRITNDAGSVESDAAQLSVTAPPKVTRHPVSQTTNPGKSVTFSVSASGTP